LAKERAITATFMPPAPTPLDLFIALATRALMALVSLALVRLIPCALCFFDYYFVFFLSFG